MPLSPDKKLKDMTQEELLDFAIKTIREHPERVSADMSGIKELMKLAAEKERGKWTAAVKELREKIKKDFKASQKIMKRKSLMKSYGAGRKMGLAAALIYVDSVFGSVTEKGKEEKKR